MKKKKKKKKKSLKGTDYGQLFSAFTWMWQRAPVYPGSELTWALVPFEKLKTHSAADDRLFKDKEYTMYR